MSVRRRGTRGQTETERRRNLRLKLKVGGKTDLVIVLR